MLSDDFRAADCLVEIIRMGGKLIEEMEFNEVSQIRLVQVIFPGCILKSDKTGLLLELSE